MFKKIEDVASYLHSIQRVKQVAVDTETWYNPQNKEAVIRFIKDPRGVLHPNNEPFIISMSTDSNSGVVIDVNKNTIPLLKQFFKQERDYIFFNANYDLHMLANIGIKPRGKYIDVMVLHQLYNEEDNCRGLDEIAKKYRDSDADKYAEAVLDVRKQLATVNSCPYHDIDYYQVYKARPDIMIPYAASDTRDTFFLYNLFYPSIVAEDLVKPFEVECAVTPIIFEIERNGYGIVEENIVKAEEQLSRQLEEITSQLHSIADSPDFNPNSVNDIVETYKKLGYNYTKKTEKGNYTADKKVLQALSHHEDKSVAEFSELVLQYRRTSKLLNTFISELKTYKQNGAIHCSFWQSGARTGRMSSSNPNLQNIDSKDTTIRSCFGPRPGYINVHLDFSQQEYRLLADHAGEDDLIEMIKNGLDVHRSTGSLITGIPYDELSDEDRDRYKQVNFALVYGLGNAAFARNLGHNIDTDTYRAGQKIICGLGYKPWALPTPGVVVRQLEALEASEVDIMQAMYVYKPEVMAGISHAQEMKRKYFARLPKIKQFIQDCKDTAARQGYIRNWIGRKKRYNNPKKEAYKAVNAVIQGGCAYILKTKLIEIDQFLRDKESRMVNLIHDEIIFEIALDELEIIPELQKVLTVDTFKVPIDCDIEYTTTNWAEKKKFKGVEELKNELKKARCVH